MAEKVDPPKVVYLVPPGKIRCCVTGHLRKDTPEENVRQRWARSLMEEYGYPITDLGIEIGVKMGSKPKRADLVIYRHDSERIQENIVVVIEAKREEILPNDTDDGVGQLKSYMAACVSCQRGLWVGKERIGFERVKDGFEQVPDIPRFGSNVLQPPTHDDLKPAHELQSVFRRCHNYIYANAGLQKGEAFHEFLKLIFCKTYDEEESTNELRFCVGSKERSSESGQRRLMEDRLTPLFQDVTGRYPFIFEESDTIRLEPRVAAYVVSELQFLSLLETETDVKGDAYEELVGANLRGDRGEFFTPRNVCDMAVQMVMSLHDENQLTKLKVLDCCCGTGGFLVSWINSLHLILRDQEEYRQGDRTRTSPDERARRRIKDVCNRNLFGLDINPFLVRTCQMNLVLHGDGASNVYRVNSVQLPGEWSEEARRDAPYGKADVVLTNPPFGGKGKIEDGHVLGQYELPAWDSRRKRSSMPAEQLFIETAMRFLKPNGYLAIVLPRGILSNPGTRFIRSWILKRSQLVAVVDLPQTTFAASKGINNPSVILLRKFTRAETQKADEGIQPKAYDLFMSLPKTAGINKRAKKVYLRNPDGREKTDEDGRRILDDQITTVAGEFQKWLTEGFVKPKL